MIQENQEDGAEPQIDAGEDEQEETLTIPKRDYEKLNQTIGSLKRENKDLKKPKDPVETPPSNTRKSDDLDFGELAYHNTKPEGVRVVHDEDVEYLRQTMKDTGKSMKDILGSKFFQSELQERQQARTVVNATPPGTRRAGGQVNELDIAFEKYMQTGQLPENRALRTQVVNKKMEYESSAGQFTQNPIVEG